MEPLTKPLINSGVRGPALLPSPQPLLSHRPPRPPLLVPIAKTRQRKGVEVLGGAGAGAAMHHTHEHMQSAEQLQRSISDLLKPSQPMNQSHMDRTLGEDPPCGSCP